MTKYLLLAITLPLACSSPSSNSNNNDSCTTQADCPSSEYCTTQRLCSVKCDASSECGSGACVAGACVECAASSDCKDASKPACDTTTNTCVQCVSAGDCAASTPVCTGSNTCVECTANNECSGTTPVCNLTTDTCAACGSDGDCASNICMSSGACADPATIVYVDGGGLDGSNCGSAASPCRSVSYAVTQTSPARNIISMSSGAYNDTFVIDDTTTTAASLEIDGHAAGITSATQGSAFVFGTSTTIRNVTFDGGGNALATLVLGSGSYDLENVTVTDGGAAIESSGTVTANALIVHGAGYAIELAGGSLSIDRATIYNCMFGIAATASSSLSLLNVMMYGITGLDIDLTNIDGAMISFSTIIGTRTIAPTAIDCAGSDDTISASIVWGEGSGSGLVAVEGCNVVNSSFVGPVTVAGASSEDPEFANPSGSDYHIGSGSPAIDLLTTGPALDFEGDTRPQNGRWDVGADEYKKP